MSVHKEEKYMYIKKMNMEKETKKTMHFQKSMASLNDYLANQSEKDSSAKN